MLSLQECVLQMEGPNVAPLTVGKQNLIVYVLRQLEKRFYEVNQFFRVYSCSHDEGLQQASISLAVISHNDITVGLDVVRSIAIYSAPLLLCKASAGPSRSAVCRSFNVCKLSCTLKACCYVTLAALRLPVCPYATLSTPPHPTPPRLHPGTFTATAAYKLSQPCIRSTY